MASMLAPTSATSAAPPISTFEDKSPSAMFRTALSIRSIGRATHRLMATAVPAAYKSVTAGIANSRTASCCARYSRFWFATRCASISRPLSRSSEVRNASKRPLPTWVDSSASATSRPALRRDASSSAAPSRHLFPAETVLRRASRVFASKVDEASARSACNATTAASPRR